MKMGNLCENSWFIVICVISGDLRWSVWTAVICGDLSEQWSSAVIFVNSRVADPKWFIPDPDPNFLFLDSRSDYGEGVASHFHVGDCVTTSKDGKIVPERIKDLIKIFSNKR